MKAIVFENFGPPDVLQLKEVEKPVPKDNEVLVKVYAVHVNYGDILTRNFRKISPRKFYMSFLMWFFAKIFLGFRKPKIKILGSEFAGEIESVGKDVERFKEGDQVFGYKGMNMGAYAEYLCMPEKGTVALKPTNMTFEEACTVSGNSLTARNILSKVNIESGQKVLINGASGGIGSIALQLAKNSGAEVTGVCGTPRLEMVKALGADKVIDYTKVDFTTKGETYNLIFDVLGKSSFSRSKKVLNKNGIYLLANFKSRQLLQMLRTSIIGSKKVKCVLSFEEDIDAIKELVEAGKIKSVIDRSFPMEQAAEAHDYVEKGLKKGYVVITFNNNDKN
ncbi:MAG: NAD(P)-dependent alcohol dehydrogenase [Candidatus Heimdallarchaeota archaeon]|nr:NAD(P)-dependent alcohol dehydrogenase [Candidatus Heimdallarchaeota archaeon]MCG3254501.1 NAD(P)-dependent alcohol dehydrogenase [Candidatus Heimdallarchaeota archaeon]MCK4609586.1 NAD(P)-dependent alcohol dehydrogenase [Candidatus Heimdallarchaeota archaeon]